MKAVILALALAIAGCNMESGDEARAPMLFTEADAPGERRYLEVVWDSLWAIGGPDDTLLANVYWMAASADGVYAWDPASSRVTALDTAGGLRWLFGRSGQGPDEFTDVRDLEVDASGQVWLLDPENLRITGLSDGGEVVRRVSLRLEDSPKQFAPLPDGTFLVVTAATSQPLVHVSAAGEVLRRSDFSWAGFNALNSLQTQGRLIASGERAAYLFTFANGWFPLEGPVSTRAESFVVHAPFPEVVVRRSGEDTHASMTRRPQCTTCSAFLLGDTVVAHASDERGRGVVLDRYAWSSGDYLNSIRLPRSANEVAAHGDRVYVHRNDPYPRILAYRVRAQ